MVFSPEPCTINVVGLLSPEWAKLIVGTWPRTTGGGFASYAIASARVTSEVLNLRVAETCARCNALNNSPRPEPCSAEVNTVSDHSTKVSLRQIGRAHV